MPDQAMPISDLAVAIGILAVDSRSEKKYSGGYWPVFMCRQAGVLTEGCSRPSRVGTRGLRLICRLCNI